MGISAKAEIIPCEFVHISQRDLEKWLKMPPYIFTKKETFTVKDKYQHWNQIVHQQLPEDTLLPTISFDINRAARPDMATHLGNGKYTGTLVFTGQISDKGQRKEGKYRDFVFYEARQHEALAVPKNILKDFFYRNGEQDKESKGQGKESKKGSSRNYWRRNFFKGLQIPVFYHVNADEKVNSIGLAYMYRLAYDYSIGETIAHTSYEHGKLTGYDFADLLFGKVYPDDQEKQNCLKSRVSFGTAIAIGNPEAAEPKYSEPTILRGTSEQIQQLKRMAYPEEANAKADKLTHLQLEEQLEGGKRRKKKWANIA